MDASTAPAGTPRKTRRPVRTTLNRESKLFMARAPR